VELTGVVVAEVAEGVVEQQIVDLEKGRVDWRKMKVFWLLELLGGHVLHLSLLLVRLSVDQDHSFPVVQSGLVCWELG
jgi:hypothetical protein